jgi:thioredoxin 2
MRFEGEHGMTATETTSKRLTIRCDACRAWNRIRGDRVGDGPRCGSCGAAIDLSRPLVLTDETFARTVAESDVPVLVDFYADWCGPCKMMAPSVEQLARERAGQALIAKLDTDRDQRTAGGFAIRGIPTSILFQGGKEVARQVGAVPKSGLEGLLAKAK